tara:strand:+ start:287 stop:409 length:123 start_codon:yes stop_codon:yes gene_type:complete
MQLLKPNSISHRWLAFRDGKEEHNIVDDMIKTVVGLVDGG